MPLFSFTISYRRSEDFTYRPSLHSEPKTPPNPKTATVQTPERASPRKHLITFSDTALASKELREVTKKEVDERKKHQQPHMPDVFNELKPYTSTFVVNKVFASPDRYSHWEYRTRSTATTLINPSEELPMERGDLGSIHFTPKKAEAPPRKVEKIEERKHESGKFKIGGDHTEESKTDDHAAHDEKQHEHKADDKETPVDVINAWIKANLQRTLVCLDQKSYLIIILYS